MLDPVDEILGAVENGRSIIKNRDVLQFKHVPETIQYRDIEQKTITQSLLPILKQSKPPNLFVYGKPGTGKTLVVKKVLSKIQEKVKKSNFPIKITYSNSKEETTLYGLLVSMGRQLGLEKKDLPATGLSIGEVLKRILERVDSGGLNVIFVIDEIDHLPKLISKTGTDILYQLTRANDRLGGSSLALVGISNDVRFKEMLDPKVLSSLGEEEVVFTNYNTEQLKKILQERIKQAFVKDVVDEAALNLCAALAGSEHGDARRAITLIRVAGELAELQQSPLVTEVHVREATKKIEENKEEVLLKSYPLHEKLAILAIMKVSGATTGEVYSTYKGLCRAVGQEALTQRRITQILGEAELSGVIDARLVSQGTHGRTKKYKLAISAEMVKNTFKDDLALQDII